MHQIYQVLVIIKTPIIKGQQGTTPAASPTKKRANRQPTRSLLSVVDHRREEKDNTTARHLAHSSTPTILDDIEVTDPLSVITEHGDMCWLFMNPWVEFLFS
ncbi:hypothetical protein Dimus_037977 [Dionaea muscipula]